MLLGNIVFLLFSSSLFAIIYLEISITYREVKSGKFTIERVSLAISYPIYSNLLLSLFHLFFRFE